MTDEEVEKEYDNYLRMADPNTLDEADLDRLLELQEIDEYRQNLEASRDEYSSNKLLALLQGTAKALDYVDAPFRAGIAELTGTSKEGELLNALNPGSARIYPGSDELMGRYGIGKGASISDVIPGAFADPAKDNPWYVPEKGGALDFTARGAGGTLADMTILSPSFWMTGGLSALAKKAAMSDVVQQALSGGAKASIPLSVMAKAGEVASLPVVRSVTRPLNALFSAPSRLVGGLGKMAYDSSLAPIVQTAEKFGKSGPDVVETYYKAGIKRPATALKAGDKAVSKLMGPRNKIAREADKAGKGFGIEEVAEKAKPKVEKLKQFSLAEDLSKAEAIEKEIAKQAELLKGTPEIPEIPAVPPSLSVSSRKSPILDEFGKPIDVTEVKVIPGKEAVPGVPGTPDKKLTAESAARKKSIIGDTGDVSRAFDVTKDTPAAKQVIKNVRGAYDEALSDYLKRTVGAKKAAEYKVLNEAAGNILTTKEARKIVQDTAAGQEAGVPISLLANFGAGAVAGPQAQALSRFAAYNTAGNLLRSTAMPTGYYMRKFSENPWLAPISDSAVRQWYIDRERGENFYGP